MQQWRAGGRRLDCSGSPPAAQRRRRQELASSFNSSSGRIYSFRGGGSMNQNRLLSLVLACALAAPLAALAQAKPVVLRFVADFPPSPHPAGLAMKHFG